MLSKKFERKPGMYELRLETSGIVYVGSSSNVYARILKHKGRLRANLHYNKKLQANYISWEDVICVVTYTRTLEEARDLEQQFLDSNLGKEHVCNIATGARNVWVKGNMPEFMREKIRASNTGLKRSDEVKQKMSESNREYFLRINGPDWKPRPPSKPREARPPGPYIRKERRNREPKPVKRISIDGVIYNTYTAAGYALGIHRVSVYDRVTGKVPGYPGWILLGE